MNKLLLYIVMLPLALWRSMGADVNQLKAILGIRLILDDRKPVAIGRNQKSIVLFHFITIFPVACSTPIW